MNPFYYTILTLLSLLAEPTLIEPAVHTTVPMATSMEMDFCAQQLLQQSFYQTHPSLETYAQALEDDAYRQAENSDHNTHNRALEIVPVVFHIIHNNGSENISDAQVNQALNHLNDAFANLGYYDQNIGVNTDIQFCLAQRDPDGNATTGIVHLASPLTNMNLESQDLALKDLSRWDPTQYINIWVVAEVCSDNQGCGVNGYALFPSAHGSPQDGIVIEAQWVGSSPANSSMLIHQMGHYLGLYHTFENACANSDCLADGDHVCDTPPEQTTIISPCDNAPNSCSTDVNLADPNNPFTSDQEDLIVNYMGYGNHNCYAAFTQGQSDRMHFFLEGARVSLTQSYACLAPCSNPAVASFSASNTNIQAGQTVTFTNTSSNATTAQWFVEGSSFATTTDASYTFNSTGTFTVTLVSNNSNPNCVNEFSMDIHVICNTQAAFTPAATTIDIGEDLTFTNNSNNAQTYEWTISGDAITTTNDLVYAFTQSGIYEVCLSANGTLCGDTTCITINVLELADDCHATYLKRLGKDNVDERAACIVPDNDGTFYMSGNRGDSLLLIKMNSDGDLLWQRSFLMSSLGANHIQDMIVDSEGYLLGCGYAISGADREAFIFRYNPNVNLFDWIQIQNQQNLSVSNYDISEIAAGDDFIVNGYSYNHPAPGLGCDGYLYRIDRNTGAISSLNQNYNLGSCETFMDAQVYNGFLYVSGRYNASGGGTNKMRSATSKFDLNGNEVWSRLYLVDVAANARLYTPELLIENDSIIQVHYGDKNGTSQNNPEVFLSKSNLNGEIDWALQYQLVSVHNIQVSEIVSSPDGYALLCSDIEDDFLFIIKTNKNGIISWAKKYGEGISLKTEYTGMEMIYVDGYYYVIGYTDATSTGDEDMVILKIDDEGNVNTTICSYIEELTILTSEVVNPYDGLHTLTAYGSSTGNNAASTILQSTTLEEENICLAACYEICDNGVDDDGDGLIDCYDPDCCLEAPCQDFYFTACPDGCIYAFVDAPVVLEVEWESSGSSTWCSYNTPITGDVDGDGIPEVIGKPCMGDQAPALNAYPNLLIVDGATGIIEDIIQTPALYYLADGPALADVDGNGYPEIFIMASDHPSNDNYAGSGPFIMGNVARRVLCYEYDGSTYVEKWMSDAQAGYSDIQQAIPVSVADFNEDGIPELYLGSQIFNALTGELIVEGGVDQHHGVKPVGDNASRSVALTVAADVLPDEFCLNCEGLELVAGGMVFSVSIDPNTPANSMINVEVIQPNSLPNPPSNPHNKDGFTSLADIDKDGDLDAVISTTNENFGIVYIWDLQTPSLLYTSYLTPASTDEGFISQANIADFDGDGFPEIGICTQEHYQVLKPTGNSATGSLDVLWDIQTDDDSGSTGSAVFDFNNDGAQEVVYRAETELRILDGSNGTTLSSLPCASGTRIEYPVIVDVDKDGETEILCSCANTLTAYGSALFPWLNARSVWNQHNYFNVNISDDLTIPAVQQQPFLPGNGIDLNNFLTMYADQDLVVGDAVVSLDSTYCNSNGDFVVSFEICNIGSNRLRNTMPIAFYENDPTSTATATMLDNTELGVQLDPGDCSNVEFVIPPNNANPFYAIVNDNGSLNPPFDLSTDFPINLMPECDFTNNIAGTHDVVAYIPLDLGPDQEICDNGVTVLDAGPGFESYLWSTHSTEQTITVYETGNYSVTTTIGCTIQEDSLEVTLAPNTVISLGEDILMCAGETVSVGVENDVFDQYEWNSVETLSCNDCPMVVFTANQNSELIVTGTMDNGCISSDTIMIEVGYTLFEDSIYLCYDADTIINGDVLSGNSFYYDTLFTGGTCDTILSITTIELPELTLSLSSIGTCPEDANGSISSMISGGSPPYVYFWEENIGNVPEPTDLYAGVYHLTVIDALGCSIQSSIAVEASVDIDFLYEIQNTTCYNTTDGILQIDTSLMDYQFSLDGQNFSDDLVFQQLACGEYTLYALDTLNCLHTELIEVGCPPAIAVLLPPDMEIYLGETVEITSLTNISDSIIYQWIPPTYLDCPDCEATNATPPFSTSYTLVVTDTMGCIAMDSILISVSSDRNVYIPNAFSPNGDGINDYVYPNSTIDVEEVVTFKIFDRWGEELFSQEHFPTNDFHYGWDGSFKGEQMNPGVYVFFAIIRFKDGKELLYSGDISIIK